MGEYLTGKYHEENRQTFIQRAYTCQNSDKLHSKDRNT